MNKAQLLLKDLETCPHAFALLYELGLTPDHIRPGTDDWAKMLAVIEIVGSLEKRLKPAQTAPIIRHCLN